MENLDRFYEWSALVLAWLYEKFPTPTSLHHGDLKSSTNPTVAERTMRYTVIFLAEEGFIRYGEFKPPGQFSQVKLSRKGLNMLNRVPNPKKNEATLGELLVKKVRSGAQGPFDELVRFFLQDSDVSND